MSMQIDMELEQDRLLLWVQQFPHEERGNRWAEAFFMLHRLWRHRERELLARRRMRALEPFSLILVGGVLGAGVYALLSWWW